MKTFGFCCLFYHGRRGGWHIKSTTGSQFLAKKILQLLEIGSLILVDLTQEYIKGVKKPN